MIEKREFLNDFSQLRLKIFRRLWIYNETYRIRVTYTQNVTQTNKLLFKGNKNLVHPSLQAHIFDCSSPLIMPLKLKIRVIIYLPIGICATAAS